MIPDIKRDKKVVRRMLLQPPSPLLPVDMSKIPPGAIMKDMTRAWGNNRYICMEFAGTMTSHGPATRLLIQRVDAEPIPRHWKEIQRIKNTLYGPEVTAVEYYPAESHLVDVKNIYWIWMFPEGVLPIFNANKAKP